MPITVKASARTHIGLVRRRNEDAVYSGRSLYAVADGLGGHPAGDVASTTAIEALRLHDRQIDPAELPAALGRAVYAASQALRRRIEAEPELAGDRLVRCTAGEAPIRALPAMPSKRARNCTLVGLAVRIEQPPALLRHGAS